MSDDDFDLFGGFPNRPDHPDFWKLSNVVLWMDGACEDEGGFKRVMAEAGVDARSLVYMAHQRAMRAYNGTDQATLMALTAVYLDAFLAGVHFVKRDAI